MTTRKQFADEHAAWSAEMGRTRKPKERWFKCRVPGCGKTARGLQPPECHKIPMIEDK